MPIEPRRFARYRAAAFCESFQYSGILHMAYDTPTVHLLRSILAEVLASQAFTRQRHQTAVDVAERILWLASQGERDPAAIKEYVLTEVLARSAA
ncbi:hypothetical protein [Bradyrhizobium sp.]|uniref:hypothetical protein n=1 Tax=Bradyrhizobium sp. TaxID=376 RepID=UPI0039E4A6CF